MFESDDILLLELSEWDWRRRRWLEEGGGVGPIAPLNALITEDGAQFLITEDAGSFLITET